MRHANPPITKISECSAFSLCAHKKLHFGICHLCVPTIVYIACGGSCAQLVVEYGNGGLGGTTCRSRCRGFAP